MPEKMENLGKIESFFYDQSYREAIDNSASFNTRLCIERRMRMPFLDSQTGVAQNHSNLFMTARQRLPGTVDGQIYSYPSKRWRKKRRQYLMSFMQPRRKEADVELDLHTINTVENPAILNEDSKDSKDETAKDAWYYDDLDIQDVDGYDDQDPDSDYDYEESYSKRKRRRGGKVSRGGGRGRKKLTPAPYDVNFDAEKPFACELCAARYKTRPGLTYHYTHSHKERDEEDDDSSSANNSNPTPVPSGSVLPTVVTTTTGSTKLVRDAPFSGAMTVSSMSIMGSGGVISSGFSPCTSVPATTGNEDASTVITRRCRQSQMQTNQGIQDDAEGSVVSEKNSIGNPAVIDDINSCGSAGTEFDRNKPSTYCDFCLGDATQNKKTGVCEELVSCSDCGRSGHPSCLQFTSNMIISVRKYRWQCIECKCCSICGNSDNDDQLLFCDDCDRGYHMYCLSPPLTSPPEGSWSCVLCLDEFHKK